MDMERTTVETDNTQNCIKPPQIDSSPVFNRFFDVISFWTPLHLKVTLWLCDGVVWMSASHLSLTDESGVCLRRAVAILQRQTLTQLSKQHGHFLHAPPATYQHHLGCHPVALIAWRQSWKHDTTLQSQNCPVLWPMLQRAIHLIPLLYLCLARTPGVLMYLLIKYVKLYTHTWNRTAQSHLKNISSNTPPTGHHQYCMSMLLF